MTTTPPPAFARASAGELLRGVGLRATPQRQVVIEILREADGRHLTRGEIAERVHVRVAGMNRSTVYRSIDDLSGAGLVTQHHLGDSRAVYELSDARYQHHHLVCVRCRRVFDLAPADVAGLRSRLLRRSGFEIGAVGLSIDGECAGCRSGASDGDRPAG